MSYVNYSRSAPRSGCSSSQPLTERQGKSSISAPTAVAIMAMRNKLQEAYPNPSTSNKVGLLTGIVILVAWSAILFALFSVI